MVRLTLVCYTNYVLLELLLNQNPTVWDRKPERKEDHIRWVELKTSAEIRNDRDLVKYERKLLKFWAQSFLLGVPKIIVGFRDQSGIVHRMEEVETYTIPSKVKKLGRATWDGNICINFAAAFLECMNKPSPLFSHSAVFTNPVRYFRVENNHHARWNVENPQG